jgi:dephospho-CoA kinase
VSKQPHTSNAPFVVGLTGGIGSGKTAVSDTFAELGAAIVDTDRIAHALTGPRGAAMAAIEAAFGSGIVASDGSLDRAGMRRRAFADPGERKRLEAILHPMIGEHAAEQTHAAATAGAPYVIQVIPLLVESGRARERFERIAVVDCDTEVQIMRVMKRSGLARADVEAIMCAQATRQARLAVADDVIDNGGSLASMRSQVQALHARYCELAKRHGERAMRGTEQTDAGPAGLSSRDT